MQQHRRSRPRLNLALQGGGAHGAFTWGVLDRLLDEDDIDLGSISGTSAGALNGAALATGLMTRGRTGARKNLAALWQEVVKAGALMSLLHVPLKKPGMGVWDDAKGSPTESLRRRGYGACSDWLAANRDALGKRSTVDIAARYLAPYRQGKSTILAA